ncbi:MAG TPA: DUF2249 domain-containing protein [Ramlibacter sp.]|nr:DUF2249 domain-containing protein [Ramlibacter sp.]
MDHDHQPHCQPVDGALPATRRSAPLEWRDGEAMHIDVRGLPPPQPLVAILRLVHSLADGKTPVVVHHDRDPVMLYPELAELGWSAERMAGPVGEFRLLLRRLS